MPETFRSNRLSVDRVALDRALNPDGKTLDREQQRQLAAVLARYDAEQDGLCKDEAPLRYAALVEAVGRGQFLTKAYPPIAASDPVQQAEQLQDLVARQRKDTREANEALSQRYGREMRDWAASVLSSASPDGVGHVSTVFYMPHQAAELFAVRQRIVDSTNAQREEARRFFATLPR